MIYEPFFDMNILISADAVEKVSYVVGGLMVFHLLFALLALYLFIPLLRKTKSTYDSEDI